MSNATDDRSTWRPNGNGRWTIERIKAWLEVGVILFGFAAGALVIQGATTRLEVQVNMLANILQEYKTEMRQITADHEIRLRLTEAKIERHGERIDTLSQPKR